MEEDIGEEAQQRRLEREFVLYGGAPPPTDSAPDECEESMRMMKKESQLNPLQPKLYTRLATMYDDGDMKVTVSTSEITQEEESFPSEKKPAAIPRSIGVDKKHNIPVSKSKSFKKVAKHRSRSKPQNKRNRKKGKKKRTRKGDSCLA